MASALQFVNGDFYSSSNNVIQHYTSAGVLLDSLTLTSAYGGTRGFAFGANGLLYSVMVGSNGYTVVSADSQGVVHETYTTTGDKVASNVSFGKIAFGSNGDFFVGLGGKVVRFTPGISEGTAIVNGGGNDVEVLPTGNLLVLNEYNLEDRTASGALVRNIASLTNARGVEYDPIHNKIFVTMIGDSSNPHALMRLNFASGAVETSTRFTYGDDMVFSTDGRLLVGAQFQTPAFFDTDLNQQGLLGSDAKMFVAQMAPVPEPATILGAVAGLGLLLRRRR